MDVVTHTIMGTVIASPMVATSPVTAGCFFLGSVLPDVDALSRGFGKAAFLRWHQTFTHSLPIIVALTLLSWPLLRWIGIEEPWAPAAFGAAMLLHAIMDATNTYGVALFSPLCRKRYCAEWVFFIDGTAIAVSVAFLTAVLMYEFRQKAAPKSLAIAYAVFLTAYWAFRWWMHRRAIRLAPPGTESVIPSAILPWRFFGYLRHADGVELFTFHAMRGSIGRHDVRQTFDSRYASWLNQAAEYRLMRELSPGYHAVEIATDKGIVRITCRDLRIRNFGGEFGRLELTFTSDGRLLQKEFHV